MKRLRSQIALSVQLVVLLVRGNWDALLTVVNPWGAESAVIAVDLQLGGERGITFYANVLSLSPGTLALGISDDRRRLYAHVVTTRSFAGIRSELLDLQIRIRDSIQ